MRDELIGAYIDDVGIERIAERYGIRVNCFGGEGIINYCLDEWRFAERNGRIVLKHKSTSGFRNQIRGKGEGFGWHYQKDFTDWKDMFSYIKKHGEKKNSKYYKKDLTFKI